MAVFNGHTVTLQGAKLLSRSLAGEGKFIFTKGAFGAGKYEGDVTTLEELVDKRLDLPISDIAYYEGAAVLNLQISNKTVEESFYTNELGIYAKLEGDQKEVLFSYAAAIKPDAIPDNSLSVTFEGEYEVYIKLTTNEKVGFQVNDDNVYITFKSGNREYVRTGCNIIGLLSVQNELVENGQYQASDGKWYLNKGGKRSWNNSAFPDEKLKEITFIQHEKDIEEIVFKFKNYCPISVGSVDVRYDNKNPAELYPGTTWELISQDKYIKSGNTALQQGGNNSISILKENLPNTKLKVDDFTLNSGTFKITGSVSIRAYYGESEAYDPTGAFYRATNGVCNMGSANPRGGSHRLGLDSSRSGATSGGFGTASPYTETLGNSTPLTIEPSYITLKFWKRLT